MLDLNFSLGLFIGYVITTITILFLLKFYKNKKVKKEFSRNKFKKEVLKE